MNTTRSEIIPNILDMLAYHRETAHTYDSVRRGGGLVWATKPWDFKVYQSLPEVALPNPSSLLEADAWEVLRGELPVGVPVAIDLPTLAALLGVSWNLTRENVYGETIWYTRSYPSAGGLYPLELYLVARGIAGLEDGVYHYSLHKFVLTRLFSGDFNELVISQCGGTWPEKPDLIGIVTNVFWRSAWKYHSRAYRYCFLDAGHAVANLVLTAHGLGLRPYLIHVFDDQVISRLLCLDDKLEAPCLVVPIFGQRPFPGPASKSGSAEPTSHVLASDLDTYQDTAYPLIDQARRITSLTGQEVRETAARWTGHAGSSDHGSPAALASGARRGRLDDFRKIPLAKALWQRRSHRQYIQRPISRETVKQLLDAVRYALVSDTPLEAGPGLSVIVQQVTGLTPGIYRFDGSWHEVVTGDFRDATVKVCLEQGFTRRAAFVLFWHTPLTRLTAAYGPRIYRAIHLAAGVMGEKAYLAAEVLGWGACGIGAFYDQEAQELLQLEDEEVVYALTVGPV
ncbi:MAG: SagB/ThcOx family dehydrogenase [Deltaproteobacteria bacterium]|nr:SagB/ThcOx family dehydrogenase [Deltaproteobacteria bacterium]